MVLAIRQIPDNLPLNSRHISCIIYYLTENNLTKTHHIVISLQSQDEETLLRWNVNLGCFEWIHGLSRIVKLLPDKLATAIQINREHLPNPKDNGSFLVQLVIELLDFYLPLSRRIPPIPALEHQGEVLVNFGSEELQEDQPPDARVMSLPGVIKELKTWLEDFLTILELRQDGRLIHRALAILELANNVLLLCHVFMDYVHPMDLDIQRHSVINFQNSTNFRESTINKIDHLNNQFFSQFNKLIIEE